MTNAGHSQFCNKHPLHSAVGVCGSCVRERLASLIQSISPEPPAAASAALPPLDHPHKTSFDALALPDLKLRGLNLRNVPHVAANFPPPPEGAATVLVPLKNSSACAADIASVAAPDPQPYSPAAKFSYGAPRTAAADNPAASAAAAGRESADPSARWGNEFMASAGSVEWDPATRWSDGHMAAAAAAAAPTAATPLSSGGKKKLGANHTTSSWFASFLTRPLILTRVPYGAAAADHQLKSVIACSAASVKKPHPPPPTPSSAAAKFRRRFKAADLQAISEICVTTASTDTSKFGTAGSSWLSSLFHRKKSSRSHSNHAFGANRSSAQNGAASPDGGSLPEDGSIPGRVHGSDAKSGIGRLQITLNISRKKGNGSGVIDAVPGSGRSIINKRDASPARSEDLYMLQQNSRRIEEEAPAAAATLQRCRSVQHQGSGGGIAMMNTSVLSMLSQQQQRRERTGEAEAPLSHAAIYSVAKQRRKEWDEEDEDEEMEAEAEAAEEQLRRYVQHDWGGSGGGAAAGEEEEDVERSMAGAGNFSRSRSWGRAWNKTLSPVLWGLGTAAVGRSTGQEGRLRRRSQQQSGSGDEAEVEDGRWVKGERLMGGRSRRRKQQDVEAAAAAPPEKHRGYDSSSAAQSYVSPLRRTIPALDMRIHSAQ